MKLIKPFRGVPNGEIYPRDFEPGDECPPELLDAAKSLGVVDVEPERQAEPAQTKSRGKRA